MAPNAKLWSSFFFFSDDDFKDQQTIEAPAPLSAPGQEYACGVHGMARELTSDLQLQAGNEFGRAKKALYPMHMPTHLKYKSGRSIPAETRHSRCCVNKVVAFA